MDKAISVHHLSKDFKVYDKKPGLKNSIKSIFHRDYKTVKAVNNISFEIGKGEVVGFIGPNGAGKTTTLKMLSGLLHPTSGEVMIQGFIPYQRKKSFLKNIGFIMGQKQQIPFDLTPGDSFLLNKTVYEIPDDVYKKRVDTLADLLDLHELLDKQVRKMSLGQRMRCEIAASLLHQPRILFLDEPTIGLDISMQMTMRNFLKDYNTVFNTTILITSHYMNDISALAKRIIIIAKGELLYNGDLDKAASTLNLPSVIKVKFVDSPPSKDCLSQFGDIRSVNGYDVQLNISSQDAKRLVEKITQQYDVSSIVIEEAVLDDVMLSILR